MRDIYRVTARRFGAIALTAGLLCAGPAAAFFDGFDVPGCHLDLTKWTTVTGAASFLGRTQLRDWPTDCNFTVANGYAELALNQYNPTGFSLYGTQANTIESFQATAIAAYDLTVRMQLKTLQPGLVFGIYFYGCDAGPCATNHDELDIEIVTNFLQSGGSPLRVQLNRYSNEPLGAGHGPIVALPSGFDPLAMHEWRIRWQQNRVSYFVDGMKLFTATDFIPQGSMQANIIAWGPDTGPTGWPDAYSPSLTPVNNMALDQRFVALVDSVSVSAPPAVTDFNGDGKSDVFWRHANGTTLVWQMNGTGIASTGSPATVSDTNWKVVGIGDFDGDGKADVLWMNTLTGTVLVWLMNGTTIASTGSPATVGPTSAGWVVRAVGDFDGDGKADILWQNTLSGNLFVWLMNGTSIASTGSPATVTDAGWVVQGVGDFDGDGKTDVLWQHTNGTVFVWLMNGTTISATGSPATVGDASAGWVVQGVGDFDGDGKADVLWENTLSGTVFVWKMNGTSIASTGSPATVGAASGWVVRGVGDYDGDGKADVLWQNTGSGTVFVWLMNGTAISTTGSPATVSDSNWQVQNPR